MLSIQTGFLTNPIKERFAFLSLPHCGPAKYHQFKKHVSSLRELLDSGSPVLHTEARAVLKQLFVEQESAELYQWIQQQIKECENLGIRILSDECENYPALLKECSASPPLLFVQGNTEILNLPQIAIVGSRKPSPGGQQSAKHISASLAKSGFVVTSGLALGVDTLAHEASLCCEAKTVAVMGCGLDTIYPARNRSLAKKILERGGALVSEFALGVGVKREHFPRRNRIISGMSVGTLVVEAAIKSGSLITARLALQQDREVFAIPGSVHNPLSRGCHALIRDGATLAESADDIVEELEGFIALHHEALRSTISESSKIKPVKSAAADYSSLSDDEQIVVRYLGYDACPIERLAETLDLTVEKLHVALLQLQLKGWVLESDHGFMRDPNLAEA